VTLILNGQEMRAQGSLLDVILSAGLDIPHLCKDDHLPAIGACRTCLVEADGRIVAACSMPAALVTKVETGTERVIRLRRTVLELTVAMQAEHQVVRGGPHAHETRETAERAGASFTLFAIRSDSLVDESSPFFTFHEDACILCGRCVVACQTLQHISAIGLQGRGSETRVTPGSGQSFRESICTACGSCVAACPTFALQPRGEH
jgi:formate dehydrogenase major subunit